MVVPPVLVVQRLRDDPDELVADVLGQELTNVHDGSVVFPAESFLSDTLVPSHDVINITVPSLLTNNIPGVSSWDFLSRAEVLPQAIFEIAPFWVTPLNSAISDLISCRFITYAK